MQKGAKDVGLPVGMGPWEQLGIPRFCYLCLGELVEGLQHLANGMMGRESLVPCIPPWKGKFSQSSVAKSSSAQITLILKQNKFSLLLHSHPSNLSSNVTSCMKPCPVHSAFNASTTTCISLPILQTILQLFPTPSHPACEHLAQGEMYGGREDPGFSALLQAQTLGSELLTIWGTCGPSFENLRKVTDPQPR